MHICISMHTLNMYLHTYIHTHTDIASSLKKCTILNQEIALLAGIGRPRISTSNQIAVLLHAVFSLSLRLKIQSRKI